MLIFIFNSKGKIFIHQRSLKKDVFPGYYDIVVGGGVNPDESYNEAAKRELYEETGIKGKKLSLLFDIRFEGKKTRYIGKTYNCVYDGKMIFRDKEIMSGDFYSIEDAKRLLKREKFPEDGKYLFKKMLKNEKIKDI